VPGNLTPLEVWRRSPNRRELVKRFIAGLVAKYASGPSTTSAHARAESLQLLLEVIRQLEEADE